MNKIFNRFLIGVLFLTGIILIPTFKASASVNVSIWIDGAAITSKTISYGSGGVTITYASTGGATSCNRYEDGVFKETIAASNLEGFNFNPEKTTTLTITCTAPDAPDAVDITARPGVCDIKDIVVSWLRSPEATYILKDNGATIYSGADNFFGHQNLNAGSSHTYSVKAISLNDVYSYNSATAVAPGNCPPSSCKTDTVFYSVMIGSDGSTPCELRDYSYECLDDGPYNNDFSSYTCKWNP